MLLEKILEGIEYKASGSIRGIEVGQVTCDSRSVARDDMFIAFRGYNLNGHKFIKEAVDRGARAILAEEDFAAPDGILKVLVRDTRSVVPAIAGNFYGHPSKKLKMAGVTGTNGKTTITYVIESILNKAGESSGVIGTINYRLNGRVAPAKNTTPGPLELQSMLAEISGTGARYAVMEVSSHALDQRRTEGILFDAGIFTNITPEHLDYHKTLYEYYIAKAKIFGYMKKDGVAILNKDDKLVAKLEKTLKLKVLTYGLDKEADVTARDIRMSLDNSSFTVATPGGGFKVSTRLIGRHNVSNILAAAAAAGSLGISEEAIKAGIEAVDFVPGRLEPVDCGQPFKVFVDFAHTEDALNNVLGLLKGSSQGEIITVFGCGGNRDRSKRPLMGETACRLSSRVFITSDNPRFEKPEDIIEEIMLGVKGKFDNYYIEPDRRKAIEKAIRSAKDGSIVILAGKGHENCQIVGDEIMPFDDREVAKEILAKCV